MTTSIKGLGALVAAGLLMLLAVIATRWSRDEVLQPEWTEGETTYELRVETRFGNGPNAAVAPRMGFYVQFVGQGMDTSAPERVRLGKSDADGRAVLRLSAAEVDRRMAAGRRMQIRAIESGYQRSVGWVTQLSPLPKGTRSKGPAFQSVGTTSFRSRLSFVKGSSLDVQPVGAMGDAVPGAKLDVLSPSPDGLTNTRAGRVEEVYPGLLTVHFAEDAAVTLFCRAGRHGTGRLDDVSLRTRKPWDWSPLKSAPPVQIPVFGSGQIEGHLADDSGNPSAGVEVRAVADLHGIGEASRSKLTYGIGQAELLTFGHLHAATTTDSNGYFSLSGLAADERFHLWAKEGWTSKGHLSFIGSASSKSGAAPLEAVVKRPHLVVDLLDAEGRFLTRPGSAQHRSGRNLDQPVILVYECREPGPGPGGAITSGRNIRPVRPTNHWLVPQPTLTNAENNGLVYELTTGCRYAVGVVGGGFRYKPKIIDVPAGSGQIRIAFGADARPAMREVTLAVVQDMDRELDVIVLDPVTLVPLLRRRYAARPDDAEAPRSDRLELPPGRYVVGLVGPEADPWLGGGHLGESQEFGRTEVTVDLRDQDASLCVHLERPASLEAVAHRLN